MTECNCERGKPRIEHFDGDYTIKWNGLVIHLDSVNNKAKFWVDDCNCIHILEIKEKE